MATPIYRYELDPTGTNPDNLVVREPHSLIPKSNIQDVRVLCPLYGPFYAESIVILDAANGRALDPATDYKITDLLSNPTLEFAKEIGQFIVITNGTVSNEVEVSYQVLGGNYQNDASAVQNVFETFLNDTRPVDWSNISGKPSTYPPSLHLHLLQDIINFGPLVVAIDSLRQAKLLNNTPMFEALIDWIKTKKTSWSSIVDKPTTVQGFGIINGVTTDTVQDITGLKNFTIIKVGRGSTAVSTDDNSVSYIATSGQLSRAEARLVPKLTQVVAGSGLAGGGALSQDVTLALGESGVSPGLYGTATSYPVLTVDKYGRVTTATTNPIELTWEKLQNKPTTVEGFAITNAVTTNTAQSITGTKTFNIARFGAGSTATNIDDGLQSGIVANDYLIRLLNSRIGALSSSNGVSLIRLGNLVIQYGIGPNDYSNNTPNVVLAYPYTSTFTSIGVIGEPGGPGTYQIAMCGLRFSGFAPYLERYPGTAGGAVVSRIAPFIMFNDGGGDEGGTPSPRFTSFTANMFWIVTGY